MATAVENTAWYGVSIIEAQVVMSTVYSRPSNAYSVVQALQGRLYTLSLDNLLKCGTIGLLLK